MKNILKSILLCATGASIAMGADQADHYISSRVKATIQQVNKNTYASNEDIITGTKTLLAKFKESKKEYGLMADRIRDALDKCLFDQNNFASLDQASKKHQLSLAYITAFASRKSQDPEITADIVFNQFEALLFQHHSIDLKQLNILQSGNIQRLLDTVTLGNVLDGLESKESSINQSNISDNAQLSDENEPSFLKNLKAVNKKTGEAARKLKKK